MQKTKESTKKEKKEKENPKPANEPPKQAEKVEEPTEPKILNTNNNNISTIKTKLPFSAPNTIGERLEFVQGLFGAEDLDFICGNAPPKDAVTCVEEGKYFATEFRTAPQIAAAVIYYLSQNFTVEVEALNIKKAPGQTPEEVLKKGKGNSEGLCNLFKEICANAGVKVDIISGMIKRRGFKYGDSLYKQSWIVINNNGKYYFIDPLFCIGDINKKGKFEKELRPFFFLTPPEFLIDSHRPDEEKYQCLQKPLNVKQFASKPLFDYEKFYNSIYKYKIKVNHPQPEFQCKDSELTLKFGVRDLIIEVAGVNQGNKKLPEDKYSVTFHEKKDLYEVKVEFPANGEYTVFLTGKIIKSKDQAVFPLLTYKIKVDIVNQKKKIVPTKPQVPKMYYRDTSAGAKKSPGRKRERKLTRSASEFDKKMKKKCYDNKDAHLYEPKSHFLKIGQDTKFKVRIKDVRNVVVLDGKIWNYLKRKDEGLYEGNFVIKNANVVICALRKNNVYTEVYEFFAMKPGIVSRDN